MRAAVQKVQRLFCVGNPLRLTAFASSPEGGAFLHARKLCAKAGKFAVVPEAGSPSQALMRQLPQRGSPWQNQKLYRTAKASPFGRGGIAQR